MADANAWIPCGEDVGEITCAVGRRVVHDEQRRAGERVEDRGRDALEVLRLVVRGQDDPRSGADGSPCARRNAGWARLGRRRNSPRCRVFATIRSGCHPAPQSTGRATTGTPGSDDSGHRSRARRVVHRTTRSAIVDTFACPPTSRAVIRIEPEPAAPTATTNVTEYEPSARRLLVLVTAARPGCVNVTVGRVASGSTVRNLIVRGCPIRALAGGVTREKASAVTRRRINDVPSVLRATTSARYRPGRT